MYTTSKSHFEAPGCVAYCFAGRRFTSWNLKRGTVLFILSLIVIGGISAAVLSPVAQAAGSEAPPFTLTSIDGTTFSLSDYSGKVVLLTLVATWCHLCNEEMGELVQLRQAYPDLVMITVSVDPTDTDETLRSFKEKYNADWLFARDTDNIFPRYQGYKAATPTVIIITPQGYISFRKVEVVPLEDLMSAVESAYSEEGELIPTATPEEKPKIPRFEVTSTIAILGVLTVSLWIVRRRKK